MPYEHVTGNTPDKSEYLDFSWYAPVWYYDNKDWPEQKATLGRWLPSVFIIINLILKIYLLNYE